MKALMTSTAALALTLSLAGSATAQTGTAIGDTSLRPTDITCQDLMSASEEERTGLVYFIAGYHAAMRQGGFGGGSASATGSIGAGGASSASADAGGGASGGTTATTGGTDTAAAGTSGDAGGGASGTTATTGGADTAAAGTSGDASGGTSAGGEASGEAGGGGDVQVARAFFAMPASDILTACANDPTMSAADAIGGAQAGVQ